MDIISTITTVPIVIPPQSELLQFIQKAEKKFSGMSLYLKERPKAILPTGEKKVSVYRVNRKITYADAIDFIQSKSGIFPNAEGLSIAIPIICPVIEPFTAVYGFDIKANLWEPEKGTETIFIPFVSKKDGGYYFGLSSFGEQSFKGNTVGSYLIHFCD